MPLSLPHINRRKVLTLLGVVGVPLLAFWVAVHVLVDADALRNRLVERLSALSENEVAVQDVSVSVFPLPRVTMHRLSIANPSESSESYLFEAAALVVNLDLKSLFSGAPRARSIELVQPALTLERYSPTVVNWTPYLPLFEQLGAPLADSLIIQGGSIYYSDAAQELEENITGISGRLRWKPGGLMEGEWQFTAFEAPGTLSIQMPSGNATSYETFDVQSALQLRFGPEFVAYQGGLSRKAGGPVVLQGQLTAEATQAREWFERLSVSQARAGAFATLPEQMPLKLNARLDTRREKGNAELVSLQLGETSGTGKVQWVDQNGTAQADGELTFEKINADQLLGGKGSVNAFFSLFLPQGVEGMFSMQAKSLRYHGVPFSAVQLTSTLSQGEMNINQASAALPGKTRLILLGIMKRDLQGNVSFDGSAEMLGEDAAQFMQESGFERVNLIPQAHSRFRARANMFLSADRGTISEMRFQGGDFYVVGGVNINPGGKHDIETTLRMRNVRLEPLAAFFNPLTEKAATTDVKVLNRRLDWLGTLEKKIYVNVLFDNFTLGDRQGVQSQFIVSIVPNRLEFQRIDMNFANSHVRGLATFDQTAEGMPALSATLDMTEFDLNHLLGHELVKHPVPRGNQAAVWSSEPFETSFLRGYDARLEISIGRVYHDSFVMENLGLSAASTNGEWRIDDLHADLWGGQLSSAGTLDVSSVPNMNTTLYMTNIDLAQALQSFAGFEALRGRASVSAELSSSGVSALDFVKNATGTFAFSGREIAIRGFDLASLVQTVPTVRSVADVVNTVRIATLRGASTFSTVDGGFYFSQGQLGTQGIKFRSRHAIGAFGGSIDLARWMLNAAIQFQLISLAADEYPAVTVLFRDSMDNPVIDLDTRSLEAWVARQKLLQ
jgi:uncharacterized protein involved in outer membrane biogenesis